MDYFKKILRKESEFPVSDYILDLFISESEIVYAKKEEKLISIGSKSEWLWVIKEGIIRFYGFENGKDRTYAFGLPATVFMSKHAFVKGLPDQFEMEACIPSVLLRISKKKVEELVKKEHEFAIWLLYLSWEELFFQEKKNSTVANGTALNRIQMLYKERPEIITKVKQKHIASYLGISFEYYTRLKKQILTNEININCL